MAMHGIHHVTAIAGKPTQNLGFYTRTLGMRFVKKTVNFDDPTTYHLYYGNEAGQPGTILTFFPWEHAAPGRAGIGMAQETSFRVPMKSLGYWVNRFVEKGVPHKAPEKRFGEPVLGFSDPDGLALALVGVEPIEEEATWANGDIPAEHAIRGFHGVTLLLAEAASTAEVLTNALGFKADGREDSLLRFRSPAAPGESSIFARLATFSPDAWAGVPCITLHFGQRATPSRHRWLTNCFRTMEYVPLHRSTDSTSGRFISTSRAVFCSRSPPISRALRWMSPSLRSVRS
jgi:catechol 2,3-dioxygenase-like lactoylglutathione lyase family enzyme